VTVAGSTSTDTPASASVAPKSDASAADTRVAASASPAASQPSLAAADAICARRNAELSAVRTAGESLHMLAVAARRHAKIELQALEELREIKPPPAQAASYRKLVAFDRAALLQVVRIGERAQTGDAAGARAAKAKAGGSNLSLLAVAARMKLRNCAAVPGLG
jgi:hypothetical protein